MTTEEGIKGVDLGQTTINQAGDAIQVLAEVIAEAAGVAEFIADNMQQQMSGVSQLGTAMDIIRQSAIETQSSTRQTQESARDLNTVAQEMQTVITRYML